ncbi:MAG: YitT family protein [Acholeplasmatales bacterium]|jgi:uncharacterized membrane-anchored protein YitT (DUF2179 family)|nr:YitT family protein [Acholeplasmatales bacterium]
MKKKLWIFGQIFFGTCLVVIGFYFFLLPTKLVTGGMMGISIIFSYFVPENFPISLIMTIGYGVLLFLGLFFLGKQFFIRTIFSTVLTPLLTFILELTIPNDYFTNMITEGRFLISSIVSGLLIGCGIGIVVRKNATTGGIDVLQNILHKYCKIPFSIAMYMLDGLIIFGAMFINFELALYGVISMIICGIVIDNISIEGKVGYTAFIITTEYEKLRDAIFLKIDRGLTMVKSIGGYSDLERKMIICTITSMEIYALKLVVNETDPKAFVFYVRTKEAYGYGFNKEELNK